MDDVIIVGAGPAGNNTALELASRGFAVTVIDARHDIGNKLCTGIVGQECIRRFPIDPALVYQDASAADVTTPGASNVRFETSGPQGQIIDRVAYVASFAHRAQTLGANYLLGERVQKVSPNADGVSVATDKGTYRSRALVLASGFGSPLTRQVGLGTVPDHVTGTQVEVSTKGVDGGINGGFDGRFSSGVGRGIDSAIGDVQIFVGNNVAPGFFSWLVPTSPGRALVGLLARRQAPDHLAKFVQQLRQDGKIDAVLSNHACWGIPLRPLKTTYTQRVLVAGDAAGQVKPTTGGGIYYSLLASEIASQVLAEALADDDLSASRLSQYQRRWKRLLSRELEVGYSARRLFEALNDQQITSLVVQAGARGVHNDLLKSGEISFDWHSRLIGKIMGHPVLGSALGLINPILARLAQSSIQLSDKLSEPSYSYPSVSASLSDPLPDSSF